MLLKLGFRRAGRHRFLTGLSSFCGIALITGIGPAAAAHGGYTAEQARAGQRVYARHCMRCHGGRMEGEAGPPLKGSPFASNLSYSKMTARQLFDFVKQHMPKNAPGSLSDRQYRQVFSYILAQNGYPKGPRPLTDKSVSGIDLLPYPGTANKSTQGQSSH
jgi:mono/diheme cytochrome c family protein